jgi:hypothetical protein
VFYRVPRPKEEGFTVRLYNVKESPKAWADAYNKNNRIFTMQWRAMLKRLNEENWY